MSTELRHLPEESRYLFLRDGEEVGVTDYSMRGNAMHITYTQIAPKLRGQGLGDEMMQQVFDHIRAETGFRVVPECSFATDWLRRHPEYQELEERD